MFSSLIPTGQLLGFVPKPVEAVLLVFPITKEFDAMRKSEDERLQKDGQPHLDPTLFYVKQTVSGILHPRTK
jgi:ubiquitin carboxyl-terminal hydrolase L3